MKIFLGIFLFFLIFSNSIVNGDSNWQSHGLTIRNTRYVNDVDESNPITSENVALLRSVWNFTTLPGSYNSATPTIKGNTMYMCSFDKYLYAIHKINGVLLWKVFVPNVTGVPGDFCRSSPAVQGNTLVVGAQRGGYVFALRANTGRFLWKVKPNPHPTASATMSGTIYENHVYIGISSQEEAVASDPSYPCCSFRGSMHKIRISDGAIVWTFWAIDQSIPVGPGEYSGVGVWGSSPSIDVERGTVYVATGNPYDVPLSVQQCASDAQDANEDDSHCIDEKVYFNSVLSLSIADGSIQWVTRRSSYDAWVVPCIWGGANCPSTPGPDADFGMAPILVKRFAPYDDILVIGQKSGVSWGINPDTGDVVWSQRTGPSAALGGSNWGSASDGERFYVGNMNGDQLPYVVGPPSNILTTGGGWTALDVSSGNIVWGIADPAGLSLDNSIQDGSSGAGPGSLVNDVYFVGSTAKDGQLYAINKYTGQILWNWSTGGSIYGGVSISGGCVYVGSGYSPLFNPNWKVTNKVLAFCLPNFEDYDDNE